MKDFDQLIYDYIRSEEFHRRMGRALDGTPPITIADAIERLLIMHVKLWGIEDSVREEGISLERIAELRQKVSYLNGVTRPRLVEGLGDMMAKAVKEGNEELVREPNLKDYK